MRRTKGKKPLEFFEQIRLQTVGDGKCVQMLHTGSYDIEHQTFARMEAFCRDNGYIRSFRTHRKIYLSDPRKVPEEKLKTILRLQVA